jgi:peptide/nickel transport system permease protein
MLDVLKSDYVRTARAKGLSERKVIFKHTLRNALNPVISSASNWFAGMLAGSVFVEYIFGWNGIGKEIVNSLQMLDYPVFMGALLSIAFMYVLLNIVTDILYTKLDPTIQIK